MTTTGEWTKLELRRDRGGNRHYLDGEPVSCGTMLWLLPHRWRADGDGGEELVPDWGAGAVLVRYEADLASSPPIVRLLSDVAGFQFELKVRQHELAGRCLRFRRVTLEELRSRRSDLRTTRRAS